jgi:predicted patatin/cPLA2 family phospholipase
MKIRFFLVLAVLAALLSGCDGRDRTGVAPPKDSYRDFQPVGFPDVRTVGVWTLDETAEDVQAFRANARVSTRGGGGLNVLALSSGGSDGAFGAGVIKGWTDTGKRPVFDVVTGVSTGSLIAPFAFLGPQYDESVKRLYTQTTTKDLVQGSFLAGIFKGGALFNTSRLRQIIRRELTDDMIDEIADAHEEGRRLLVGTTHMDAAEPVIWNLGKIATAHTPEARELIRDVLWASSAIPIAFTPVEFDVTDGQIRREEMHVDGGVTQVVFVYGAEVPMRAILRRLGISGRDNRIWLIHNNPLFPAYTPQPTGLIKMATRTIDTLIAAQSVGDIQEVRALAERDGFTFRLMLMPKDFDAESTEIFDVDYMRKLYAVGEAAGADLSNWQSGL